jgi:hypothetical protein
VQLIEAIRTIQPPSLTSVDPSLPPELEAAIESALRKDPSARVADLALLRAALDTVRKRLVASVEPSTRLVAVRSSADGESAPPDLADARSPSLSAASNVRPRTATLVGRFGAHFRRFRLALSVSFTVTMAAMLYLLLPTSRPAGPGRIEPPSPVVASPAPRQKTLQYRRRGGADAPGDGPGRPGRAMNPTGTGPLRGGDHPHRRTRRGDASPESGGRQRQDAEKVRHSFAATTFAAAQQREPTAALCSAVKFPRREEHFQGAQSIYRQAAQEAQRVAELQQPAGRRGQQRQAALQRRAGGAVGEQTPSPGTPHTSNAPSLPRKCSCRRRPGNGRR